VEQPSLDGDRSERYAVVLGEIRVRFDEIASFGPWDWKTTEIAALHARKIIELIVYGSLLNNQDAVPPCDRVEKSTLRGCPRLGNGIATPTGSAR